MTLKILRVIATMNPASGGPCQGIRNSISSLQFSTIETEVVCLDSPTDAFLKKDTFIVHAVGPSKGPWAYSNKLLPWLLQNLSRFDIVIIHGLWLYPGYAVRKALIHLKRQASLNSTGIPKMLVMPHGMLDPYFQKAINRRLKAFRNWFYWKLVESRIVNNASAVLFTCDKELQLAKETFSPYSPKIEINIGYGIPRPPMFTEIMRSSFFTSCSGIKDGRPYLLFLSRIDKKKGVDLLVEAYLKIIKTVSRRSIIPSLVIAGPGIDTSFGRSVQKIVDSNEQLRSLIFFPGLLGGAAKWGAFYGCEAFILPSHQENFGIAVVEALACSKPVLITKEINICAEIQNGKAGIIEDDTINGTVALIEKWIRMSDEQKKKMEQNAKKVYEENFSIEGVSTNILELYKRINLRV